jgi:peptidyl-prolyl cis-trans isomerase D
VNGRIFGWLQGLQSMLQTIHDKLKGWLAIVVLGAIGLVFVFWGINWTLSAPNYAAKVNGSEISTNEVRQAYQQQLAQFERQSPGPLDDLQRNEIKRHVLDQYVNTEAVVTRADKLGYRVSDSELLAAMAQIPAFQVDGKFDKVHALALLRGEGRSVTEIEDLIRRDVKLRQLDQALGLSSFATPTEVTQLRALTQQQRELSWFKLSAAKYAADATPDDAALKAYYDAHKPDYMTPETVNLRYIELSVAQLESKVTVDEAQLKAYYEDQKVKTPERFTQAEQRRIRHILLQVPDPKDDAAVKAKADALLKRAQAGEDFSSLATQFSQDSGSAPQGGDLGWSERKAFVTPFADAAFSMKEGEIRGPVKTQFGYHILKLDGIQPAAVKTFEQAKGELESEYRRNCSGPAGRRGFAKYDGHRCGRPQGRTHGARHPEFQPRRWRRRFGQRRTRDRGGLQSGRARWPFEPHRRGGKRPRRRAARHGSQTAAAEAARGRPRRGDRGLEEAARDRTCRCSSRRCG